MDASALYGPALGRVVGLVAAGMGGAFLVADFRSATSRVLSAFLACLGLAVWTNSGMHAFDSPESLPWWARVSGVPTALSLILGGEWLRRIRQTIPAAHLRTRFGDVLLRIAQGLGLLYGVWTIVAWRTRAEWMILRMGTFEGLFEPALLQFGLPFFLSVGWSTVGSHRLQPGEGGLLHDLGSHAIDLVSTLAPGLPEAIAATTSSLHHPDDRVRMHLSFPDGSLADCDLSYGRRSRERLTIEGPEGIAVLLEPNAELHLLPAGRRRPGLPGLVRDAAALGTRALLRSRSFGRSSIRSALAAFVEALARGEPLHPGWAEGTANARRVAAAAASIAEGGAWRSLEAGETDVLPGSSP